MLNKYMKKAGIPQHSLESFKAVYDETPELQDLVKFDNDGVTIYNDSTDKLPDSNPELDDKGVEKMAKRATDLGD